MKKVPTGYRVNVTNRVQGLLEQGGVSGRVVIVGWGAVPGLCSDTDLSEQYNELYTYQDMIRDCAFGRCGDQSKVKVLRKGHAIL